jgi:uncharacterized membrane protein YjgN (DUF898 family)
MKPMGRFHGTGGELFVLFLKNGFLTLITLGIYSAWGKAALYRFFFSNTEFAGHRFQFTGTGKEIFLGILKAFLLLGAILAGAFALSVVLTFVMPKAFASAVFVTAIYGGIILLSAYSLFASTRYRLSRARYRGLAFRLEGSPWEFTQSVILKVLFCILTLGLYSPVLLHHIKSRLFNQMRYGNLKFAWDAPIKEYWVLCIKGYFLSIFTLGIYYFFWKPQMYTFIRKHLTLGGQRFQGSFTPGQFAAQVFTNIFLAIVTLGFALPWILVRDVQFRLAHLALENPEILEAAVKAEAQKGGATAESLAGIFDMDVGVGF